MNRVLNLILTHQKSVDVERLLKWWSHCSPRENILIAYGGTEEEFNKLSWEQKIFIADPRLRVKDLARGKQSYNSVLRAAADWLKQPANQNFTHVYFAEFDHLPLVPDLAKRLLQRLATERADVLAHHLHRVDGSSFEFYLYHLADPAFMAYWHRISVRTDKEAVFQMLGTGTFWTRQAFLAVANQPEEISAYLEIYIPTLAHHLGYRVRDFADQNTCSRANPIPRITSVEIARNKGGWTTHPMKAIPENYEFK
jgi:hypothetical protein